MPNEALDARKPAIAPHLHVERMLVKLERLFRGAKRRPLERQQRCDAIKAHNFQPAVDKQVNRRVARHRVAIYDATLGLLAVHNVARQLDQFASVIGDRRGERHHRQFAYFSGAQKAVR